MPPYFSYQKYHRKLFSLFHIYLKIHSILQYYHKILAISFHFFHHMLSHYHLNVSSFVKKTLHPYFLYSFAFSLLTYLFVLKLFFLHLLIHLKIHYHLMNFLISFFLSLSPNLMIRSVLG